MPRRASIFEIVGAWLRLWTPPRDVEIPPVPWKKLALWTGAAIVVVGAALAVMVPRIDSGPVRPTLATPSEQRTRRRMAPARPLRAIRS